MDLKENYDMSCTQSHLTEISCHVISRLFSGSCGTNLHQKFNTTYFDLKNYI